MKTSIILININFIFEPKNLLKIIFKNFLYNFFMDTPNPIEIYAGETISCNFKEYTNLQGYYLCLKYENKQIEFTIFNQDILDGIKYELKINYLSLCKLSKLFDKCNNIQDIFDELVELLDQKKYKIIKKEENILLVLSDKDEFNQIQEVKLNLVNKGRNNDDYTNFLLNEIKSLRNSLNEINILKEEITKLKNFIMNKIEIPNQNIKETLSIEEFNKKTGFQIVSNKIEDLRINGKRFNNQNLEDLSKVELNNLKCLYLGDNDINEIIPLQNANFQQLEILSLRTNLISDISILEKVNFPNLKNLFLNNNIINNIEALRKVNFPKLEILGLHTNMIKDISPLENAKFPNLKELYLNHNNISNINPLGKADFKNIEKLSFDENDISDISILEKVNFIKLKKLYLPKNRIKDIKCLENANFPELIILSLHSNEIKDINIFQNSNFIKLKELYLYRNNINDIKYLEKINSGNLKILDITGNKIDTNFFSSLIKKLDSRIEDFRI